MGLYKNLPVLLLTDVIPTAARWRCQPSISRCCFGEFAEITDAEDSLNAPGRTADGVKPQIYKERRQKDGAQEDETNCKTTKN